MVVFHAGRELAEDAGLTCAREDLVALINPKSLHGITRYAFAYTVLRIIRKPLINSRIPSSREYFVQ
jgi:hypothetical protein